MSWQTSRPIKTTYLSTKAPALRSSRRHQGDAGQQLYLLIDEYDHFGNRLLSDERKNTYDELVKASGFDLNVRTDYGRLYQIAKSTSEKDRDIRDFLEEILTNESIHVELVEQFGTKLHMGRAQVTSVFFTWVC